MTSFDDLREIAESARAAHDRMMELGEGIGSLTRSERDVLDDYDQTFGPDYPTVLALLDVVDAANAVDWHCFHSQMIDVDGSPQIVEIVPCGQCGECRVNAALARLQELVRAEVPA